MNFPMSRLLAILLLRTRARRMEAAVSVVSYSSSVVRRMKYGEGGDFPYWDMGVLYRLSSKG
jgi:hypothetical protein